MKTDRALRGALFSVSKNYFGTLADCKKRSEAEQLAPVGVQRYGRARVAMEVKILAKQVFRPGCRESVYMSMLKSGFLPCHPERKRRILAVSKEKRFFVTAFLRMTKGESITIF